MSEYKVTLPDGTVVEAPDMLSAVGMAQELRESDGKVEISDERVAELIERLQRNRFRNLSH